MALGPMSSNSNIGLGNAREAGYEIKVIKGIEYPFKARIFNKFVETMFDLKKNSTLCSGIWNLIYCWRQRKCYNTF